MTFRRFVIRLTILLIFAVSAAARVPAQQLMGTVKSGGFPVPGANVTAQHGSTTLTTITDEYGQFHFGNLEQGIWRIHVSMLLFFPEQIDFSVTEAHDAVLVTLKMMSTEAVEAAASKPEKQGLSVTSATGGDASGPSQEQSSKDSSILPSSNELISDSLLINGSENNAATSNYSSTGAFGNRRNSKSIYTGAFALHISNALLDARPYSLSGLSVDKPSTDQLTMDVEFSGPLRIPHLLTRGPNFFISYQWKRGSSAQALSGLVPTAVQRAPSYPVDPVAAALLALYPLPSVSVSNRYNYQYTSTRHDDEDGAQLRLDRTVGLRDSVSGGFATQSALTDSTNLFGFTDSTHTLGLNAWASFTQRVKQGTYLQVDYRFSRQSVNVDPFFMNRRNVAGDAGMTGNLQDGRDWGPPVLTFSSGITPLSDAQSAFNRFSTESIKTSVGVYRGRHNVEGGGSYQRQSSNYLQETDPRGTFNFTGLTSSYGSDLDSFLHGVPDSASIAYGNADKYLREDGWSLYIKDDWRVHSGLTLGFGVRWEYNSPAVELKNRLVNLDIADGFSSAAPVLASSPVGAVTGNVYPRSLVWPVRSVLQPRLGFSWRPFPAGSIVIRAGYGVYSDESVYRSLALSLAQQAPLSRTINVSNSTVCPQMLASGPNACAASTLNTFAIDPNFRAGQVQVWQLSAQRDLRFALQLTATYSGSKGSNGAQDFLPNTFAPGAQNPCAACPIGFLYRSSSGTSSRNAGALQIRRRLRSGFSASLQYTWAHSIDDDSSVGGLGDLSSVSPTGTPNETIAQNWRDLRAERSSSSFDQRQVLNGNLQYTTGMGLSGGTLLQGWRGRIYKEWTFTATLAKATGKPLTPVYYTTLLGTGYVGSVRPSVTGTNVYDAAPGYYLNPKAFTAPPKGQFGDAGRYSITGPGQFTLDSSISRTFRMTARYNLDVRADSANLLNHPVRTSFNTVLNTNSFNPTFGLPTSAGNMRSLEVTARLRF